MANEWGWDFVAEYHSPALAIGDDDDTKIRKTKKLVEAKRLDRAKKVGKFGNNKNVCTPGQVKYMVQNAVREASFGKPANFPSFSSYSDRTSRNQVSDGYNRYKNYECNNCGVKGHIFNQCPARTGSSSNTAGGGR